MIAATLPIPAGPTAVAHSAAGAPARPGVEEAGGLGTFTRALETASTDVAPPTANRADQLRDRPSHPTQDVVAKPEQRVAPAGTVPGRRPVVVTTPAAVPAVAGDSLRRARALTAVMRDEPPVAPQDRPAMAELPPPERPSTVGAPAPEGTICTAPAAADDATALLAELHARHAAGPAAAETDRPAVQPGQPSPAALSMTRLVADGPAVKPGPLPGGSEWVGPAPGAPDAPVPQQEAATDPQAPAQAGERSTPGSSGAIDAAPATAILHHAAPVPGPTETAVPAAEGGEAAPARASETHASDLPKDTHVATAASDGSGAPAAMPSLDGLKVAPPGSGAPSALVSATQTDRGGDDTPVNLSTPSMTPTSASPGEQAVVRTDVTGASFTLPAVQPSGGFVGATTAPVVEGRLGAAPGSADFGTQFGAQITTFVREGVQHARLHLNPAELGPVTVRIQLDGQAAQVHLAADNALTRQALEQSMPLLAGSLREAGLTLGGGGVFEQPRQRDDDTPGASGRGLRQSDKEDRGAEATLRPLAAAPVRRGVVDLVA